MGGTLRNIYVGNIPWSASDEQLRELFAAFGSVSSARVITDRETGRSRGFGFVEMEDGAWRHHVSRQSSCFPL